MEGVALPGHFEFRFQNTVCINQLSGNIQDIISESLLPYRLIFAETALKCIALYNTDNCYSNAIRKLIINNS